MRSKLIVSFLIAFLCNAVHAGEIFRCIAANGDVMFTNMACPANSQVQHVANYEPVPDAPTPAYSVPSSTVAVTAAADPAQARAAYQAGYQQAQAEAQREQSSSESDYAAAWIPFFPAHNSHSRGHHHHPRQTMTTRAPHVPDLLTHHR